MSTSKTRSSSAKFRNSVARVPEVQPAVAGEAVLSKLVVASAHASHDEPEVVEPEVGEPEVAKAAKSGAGRPKSKVLDDDDTDPVPLLQKKDIIDRVVALSGVKKRDAKGVIEATLSVIGDALTDGASLNLPPLGKLTVNRQKDVANGEVLIVKVRRHTIVKKAEADPLADIGDDG